MKDFREVIEFYREINELHLRLAKKNILKVPRLDEKKIKEVLEQGLPLINLTGFYPDLDIIQSAADDVCAFIKNKRPKLAYEVEKVNNYLKIDSIKNILKKILWQDDRFIEVTCNVNNLNHAIFRIVTINILKPAVRGMAENFSTITFDCWSNAYCPICGWKPLVASTGENNSKVMHCSLCNTGWETRWMSCPHCSNEDHETMGCLTFESELNWIHVCDKCRGYMKVLNSITEGPDLENVKTLYLDLAANRQGYSYKGDIKNRKVS